MVARYPYDEGGEATRREDLVAEPGPADGGVDDTLIHWMLGLTPAERLAAAQDLLDLVAEVREPVED